MSLVELQKLLKNKDVKIRELTLLVSKQNSTIEDLKSKLDQFKSILPSTIKPYDDKTGQGEVIAESKKKKRGMGISAEPNKKEAVEMEKKKIITYPKPKNVENLITNAIYENDFMKNLKSIQIKNIVDSMRKFDFKKDIRIITEGEEGSMVYVLEEGSLSVSKDGKHLKNMGVGVIFGELAILYNCTRTASIKTLTSCIAWAIDRNSFQSIMMFSELSKQNEYFGLLKELPLFAKINEASLNSLVDTVKEVSFKCGEAILKQGTYGEFFYVLIKGKIRITRNSRNGKNEIEMEVLKNPAVFGTQILDDVEMQPFNCVAHSPEGVFCLKVEISQYKSLSHERKSTVASAKLSSILQVDKKFADLTLSDFQIVATLGMGGFGRVELVIIKEDESRSYALKCLNKQNIVRLKQEQHLINEKQITMACTCQFIIKSFRTFKDSRFLYILSEACLGGELWTILRDRKHFSDSESRFYVACIVEAFSYLHGIGIVFRDLKPENMLLDQKGYVKLVDFGFAKKLKGKTWTFCGTPEYVSPEIILNKGHDFTTDLWSLGILTYELIVGLPPFTSKDPLSTYNAILRGIDSIVFSARIGSTAKKFIKKLCKDSPNGRLGSTDNLVSIKKHKWFDSFNWESLCHQSLKPPIAPRIVNEIDVANFDEYPDDNTVYPEVDTSQWDSSFCDI